MEVIIFGAGISGLTAAHELLDKGYKVTLYEKLNEVGGFARSRREMNGLYTEHSWRGYGPFYKNFFDIAKRIPQNKQEHINKQKDINNKKYTQPIPKSTVYDNLSYPIKFLMPHDSLTKRGIESNPTLRDNIISGYYILKGLTADKRREVYSKKSFKNSIIDKISDAGIDNYIKSLGPGLGLNINGVSITHITKFAEMEIAEMFKKKKHIHKKNKKEYIHEYGYHLMNKPTSEAWFNPWIKHLKKKGLILKLNSELKKIKLKDNVIKECIITTSNILTNVNTIVGNNSTIFIFCVNPFNFKEILNNSNLLKKEYPELFKFKNLTQSGSHAQPSFRLIFNKKINLPRKNLCFTFPDSEFIITLYSQENFFEDKYLYKPVSLQNSKSEFTTIWSGTICEGYKKGKLYNKSAVNLNKPQLMEEIIFQIMRSKELKKFIEKNNDYKFEELKIIKNEIWYEWQFDNKKNKLITTNPKWVNNLKTFKYRPNHKTNISNLFLGGAHCKTTTDIWSMEGAVESGKIVTGLITDSKLSLDHTSPSFLKPFQFIDNILYKFFLPSIIDFILLLILIIISFIVKDIFNIFCTL